MLFKALHPRYARPAPGQEGFVDAAGLAVKKLFGLRDPYERADWPRMLSFAESFDATLRSRAERIPQKYRRAVPQAKWKDYPTALPPPPVVKAGLALIRSAPALYDRVCALPMAHTQGELEAFFADANAVFKGFNAWWAVDVAPTGLVPSPTRDSLWDANSEGWHAIGPYGYTAAMSAALLKEAAAACQAQVLVQKMQAYCNKALQQRGAQPASVVVIMNKQANAVFHLGNALVDAYMRRRCHDLSYELEMIMLNIFEGDLR